MVDMRVQLSSVVCVVIAVSRGNKKPRCEKVWQCGSAQVHTRVKTLPHQLNMSAEVLAVDHRAVTTSAMRKYIENMDETGLAPRQIWSGLHHYSDTPPLNGAPIYEQLARCVKSLRAKHGGQNLTNSINTLVRKFSLHSGIDADKSFMFGTPLGDDGFLCVRNGEDDKSLVIGETSFQQSSIRFVSH